MGYQVLARKFRPAGFDALVGQEHVVRALRHALDNDRLHHAYLFTGTRGVGKTTIARLVAKSLNCERGVSASPCGECSVCREIAENRFVDLIEVDAASRTGVGDTRELLENAQYLPTRGRYKVYLIDEVHMLSTPAFNALLKTLEEPPEHVKFLLATTDPKKVPVTALSRCLQFQLKNISSERIAAYLAEVLQAEEISFEPEALETIAVAALGSMRDALSITDQAIAYGGGALSHADVVDMLGLVGRDEVHSLLEALASGDAGQVLAMTAELAERAADFEEVLGGVIAAFHRMAVEHATGSQADLLFGPEVVQLYYQIALMGYRDMHIVPDPRSGFEMTLLRMIAFAPDEAQLSPGAAPSARAKPAPEKRPVPETTGGAAGAESTLADGTPWHDMVESLEIGGVVRMIAEHSVVGSHEGDRLRLTLDKAHDTLLNASQQAALQRALSLRLGSDLRLEIEAGSCTAETPAQRTARIAAERQHQAEQTLKRDGVVQSLLSEFDGTLGDVRPMEDSAG